MFCFSCDANYVFTNLTVLLTPTRHIINKSLMQSTATKYVTGIEIQDIMFLSIYPKIVLKTPWSVYLMRQNFEWIECTLTYFFMRYKCDFFSLLFRKQLSFQPRYFLSTNSENTEKYNKNKNYLGFFFMFLLWVSNWSSTICYSFSFELLLHLCKKPVEHIFVALFLGSLFCSIYLYVYPFAHAHC